MYAQQKRRPLQTENPAMSNADISRLLGEMWRNASPSEKQPHMEREEVERKLHKAKMEKWKNNQKLENAMKPSTPRSYRVTTPRAISVMEGNGGDRRKLDRRQDVATFIREGGESHSRFGKSRIRNVSISPLLCTVISPNLLPTPPPLKILDRACCYRRRHIQRMHPLLIGFITRLPKTIIIIITIIVEPTAVVPMSTDMIHRLGLHYRRLHSMQQPPQQRERFTA